MGTPIYDVEPGCDPGYGAGEVVSVTGIGFAPTKERWLVPPSSSEIVPGEENTERYLAWVATLDQTDASRNGHRKALRILGERAVSGE